MNLNEYSRSPRSFVLQLREALRGTMAQRAKDAQNWDALYYAGASLDKDTPAILNIIKSRIDTQAGNLFSPDRLTFRFERDAGADDDTLTKDKIVGSFLSRELREADADLEFSDANLLALRHGAAGGQVTWDGHNLTCDAMPSCAFGVLNEHAKGFHEQPAFLVSYSIPVSDFEKLARAFRQGAQSVGDVFDKTETGGAQQMNDATKVVFGLNQPIGSGSSAQAGFVNLLPRPPYIPAETSVARHVAIDAVWIHRDDGRWATVYVVEDGMYTIGTDQWRNFLALDDHGSEDPELAKHTPYFYVCPHPVKGQIFGRSQIADVAEPQRFTRKQMNVAEHILDMRGDPAHVGYGAIQTAETYKQNLRTPGGWVTESGPNAKVQQMAPEMPPELLQFVEAVMTGASDAANAPPVVQGRGEQGVRAGAHAETLMIAASARERRPATRIVRQCGDMGDLAFAILQAKCADLIPDGQGGRFLLSSVPEGFHVYCNGYTASPLFAGEHRALVMELLQTGTIGPEEVLDMLNPEGYDLLVAALKKRQEAQAQFVQEHPEVVTQLSKHRKR